MHELHVRTGKQRQGKAAICRGDGLKFFVEQQVAGSGDFSISVGNLERASQVELEALAACGGTRFCCQHSASTIAASET
jgi:hypothetical protein